MLAHILRRAMWNISGSFPAKDESMMRHFKYHSRFQDSRNPNRNIPGLINVSGNFNYPRDPRGQAGDDEIY